MIICYVFSIFYLIIMFMIYKRSNNKLCLMSCMIYSISLLICYNTFIVYLLYLLGIKGSILLYSIINYLIASIIGIIIYFSGKKIQKYYVDKKKLLVFILVGVILFLVGYFKFRGFEAISFNSGDSGIHYAHTLKFSQELSILDVNNSKDEVAGCFVRVMPISYINGGLLFNILSNEKPCIVFSWYNVGCLVLSGLLFLVTLIDCFKLYKKDYFYFIFYCLVYIFAFPLNNFIMGFCYLSLSIMVINLLYLTLYFFKDSFNKSIIFKIINIFLITFSCFYSYYLFVPVVYLALGLYYIYLWKKKNISFKQLILYGILTLIVPFIMGFLYFFVTLFQEHGGEIVLKILNTSGYCYVSVASILLFVFGTIFLGCYYNKTKEVNYLTISLFVLTIYIFIFIVLLLLGRIELYYFFKLFSVYWLFLLLFLFDKVIGYRKIFYFIFIILLVANLYLYLFPNNKISIYLMQSNIYSYNTRSFFNDGLIFEEEELDLLEKSVLYNDICKKDKHFLLLGGNNKHIWAYYITGNLPVLGTPTGDINYLFNNKVTKFDEWEDNADYSCLIYYYEGRNVIIDEDKYQILYDNDKGAIIKRR